ncbi:MAG TPA: hypothetical protein VFH18_04540 [Erysipelotrichaceae bacterium]|nr:hypothetical protein [Erysipelotrichaceae bacterium]
MNDLLKLLMDAIQYVPPQMVNTGIILYLIWFTNTHKKDHLLILDRLEKKEAEDVRVSEVLNEIQLLVLKSIITNKDIPENARLDSFDAYKKIGGNSWVDKYVEENLLNSTK